MSDSYGKSAVRWMLALALLFAAGAVVMITLLRRQVDVHRAAFAAEIASRVKLREPVFLEDLSPDVDDLQNPANSWHEAFQTATEPEGFPLYELAESDTPFTAAQQAIIAPALATNTQMFNFARQAVACSGTAVWPIGEDGYATDFSGWATGGTLRRMQCLLAISAMDAAYRGDDAIAFERLEQLNKFRIDAGRAPGTIGRLVEHIWLATVTRVAVAMGQRTYDAAHPFPKEQVRLLIAALLDDRLAHDLDRHALLTDRIPILHGILTPVHLGMDRGSVQYSAGGNNLSEVRPMSAAFDEATLMLKIHEQALDAFDAPTYAASMAASQRMPTAPPRYQQAVGMWFLFGTMQYPPMVSRHLTAIAVALEWYAAEHDGKFPDSLDALVPTYLPRLPQDPMSTDGKFHFQNDADPVVYATSLKGPGMASPTSRPDPATRFSADRVFLRYKK